MNSSKKKLNNIVVGLIIGDFFLQSGWGLIGPIFAIFVTQQVERGTAETVAFATALYWLVKSTIQPFLANILDLIKGEEDDFKVLIFGIYLASLVPLGYFFATQRWHIFLLEAIRGVAMACAVPTWSGIFTRHLNKGWETFSWSVRSTGLGFASAFTAALGGVIATFFGFRMVFVAVSLLKVLSATTFLLIYNKRIKDD